MLNYFSHQIYTLSAIAGLAQSIELQSEAQNLGSLSTLLGAFGLGQLSSSSGEVGDLISPIKTTLSQNGFGHKVVRESTRIPKSRRQSRCYCKSIYDVQIGLSALYRVQSKKNAF